MSNGPSRRLAIADWSPALLVAAVLGLLLLVVAVTAAVSLLGSPGGPLGPDPGDARARIVSFEHSPPHCDTHRTGNSSTSVDRADGSVNVTVSEEVPVASPASDLEADLQPIGTGRYLLAIVERPGDDPGQCYYEVDYTVTLSIPRAREYTVMITHYGYLAAVTYSSPGEGGSWGTSGPVRPPSMTDAAWERALNASDAYYRNHSEAA